MPQPPNVYAQCRSLGHEWKHATGVERHAWGIVQRSVCADCGTQREKSIGRRGDLQGTRYTYPEGYSQHGDERLPLSEWRSLFVVSFLDVKEKRRNGPTKRKAS